VPEARKAGLGDPQINEAIHLADQIRRVPAGKVLATALRLVPGASAQPAEAQGSACAQAAPTPDDAAAQACRG
jgi:hypothetical protein